MASDQAQARRRDNTTIDVVEKERVPKMASHFESLVDRARESDIITGGKVTPHEKKGDSHSQDNKGRRGNTVGDTAGAGKARESHELGAHAVQSLAGQVRDMHVPSRERGEEKGRTGGASSVREFEMNMGDENDAQDQGKGTSRIPSAEQHTLGQISQLRAAAQQNSMEAIRAAEERYNANKGKESAIQGLNAADEGTLKDTSALQGAHFSQDRGHQAKDTVREAKQSALPKDITIQGISDPSHRYAQERGAQAKNIQQTGEAQDRANQEAKDRANQDRANQEAKDRANQDRANQEAKGRANQEAKDRANQEAKDRANQEAKDRANRERANQEAKDRANQGRDVSNEKRTQGKDSILQGAHQNATEKGCQAEDVVLEGAQKTSQYLSEKTGEARDTLTNVGETSLNYTQQAKDYALQAKDTVVDVSKNAASYTGDKMVAAKDVTVESGKGATEYAGKVASDMAEKVPVVGWTAAHYTTEKAVQGTKIAAKVVQEAGQKAVDVAAKPLLNVAKNAAATTGETLKDYTARKKEKAQREFEAKKSAKKQGLEEDRNQEQGNYESQPTQESHTTQQKMRDVDQVQKAQQGNNGKQSEEDIDMQESFYGWSGQGSSEQKGAQEHGRSQKRERMEVGGGDGGLIGAIGETIVEIAQTTKDMVIGGRPG